MPAAFPCRRRPERRAKQAQNLLEEDVRMAQPLKSPGPRKPCPFCKEEIHPEAKLCPHCRSNIARTERNAALTTSTAKFARNRYVLAGVALAVLGPTTYLVYDNLRFAIEAERLNKQTPYGLYDKMPLEEVAVVLGPPARVGEVEIDREYPDLVFYEATYKSDLSADGEMIIRFKKDVRGGPDTVSQVEIVAPVFPATVTEARRAWGREKQGGCTAWDCALSYWRPIPSRTGTIDRCHISFYTAASPNNERIKKMVFYF